MASACDHTPGASLHDGACRVAQRSGCIDHVIYDDAVLVLDIADQMHDLTDIGPVTTLVDNGQRRTQTLRIGACTLHAK